jgi:hypothetical protein
MFFSGIDKRNIMGNISIVIAATCDEIKSNVNMMNK